MLDDYFASMATVVISVANFKGGVGKTTTCLNLGAGIALKDKRVLLIDTDAQANLTESLGFNLSRDYQDYLSSYYESIKQGKKREIDPIRIKDNLHLVPASLDLANADSEYSGVGLKDWMLKKLLKDKKKDYDFILIDCPPSMGILTKNALSVSDFVLIPTLAEFLPTRGIKLFIDAVTRFVIKEGLNEEIKILGIVLTQHSSNAIIARELVETIKRKFSNDLLSTTIRKNVSLSEAQYEGKDIFTYDSECNGAKDYKALTTEILDLLQ